VFNRGHFMEIEKISRQLVSLNKLEEYKDSDQFLDHMGRGTVYAPIIEVREPWSI
jgi:hypothetical protein